MNNLVSVIIPTYKSGNTLIRAIESVLNQTYKTIEVIVVDDNSPETDYRFRTEQLMAKYNADKRVKYIKHERNKNGSAARNTAFRNSTGDYIAFLDDDDYFLPKKIEHQVAFLDLHKEHGGCYCWRKDHLGNEVCGNLSGDFSYEMLALIFTPYTSSIMIRRECYIELNGFDESYIRHQDFEFLLRFFKKYSMGYVPYIDLILSKNGINNTPKGQKLIDVKIRFFKQFNELINIVTKDNIDKRKAIYANHFAATFKDLIRYGFPLLALQVYFKYGRKGGYFFWKTFFKLCTNGMKERLNLINK